jgi:transcriptional regulator of acetoin/glycerol metabolism
MDQRVFRDDLYYRINGISVKLPALRERTDLAALCQKILRELSPNRPLTLQSQLREDFLRYAWPGNLRQLSNVLKTASVLVENESEISSAHLPDDFLEELATQRRHALRNGAAAPMALPSMSVTRPSALGFFVDKAGLPSATPLPTDSTQHLEKLEITAIMQVLNACAGNVSLASKQLNISRNTIYRKVKKFI